uniref:Uncharacterized protein n=1 Tax=viral metagenome TaxID=1070528 RepID=A0A6C0D7J7_9ZZZZ
MGADISLQRLPNRSEIQDKTETTIFLMNRILDFILRNADIADIVSLATDEGCKKYIIIAESKLSVLFNKIRIQPELGDDGTLYLKRITDLEKESKQGGLNKQYCSLLSFFFIRLFQVVGALALSVLDTSIPLEDYSKKEKITQFERKGIPFFKPDEEKKSLFSRIFRGGSLTDNNKISGKYEFLNNYLTYLNTNQYQLNTFSKARDNKDKPLPLYASRNSDSSYKFDYNSGSTAISFNVNLDDMQRNIILNNIILNGNDTSIKFTDTFSYSSYSDQALISTKSIDFAKYLLDKLDEIQNLPKSQVISILKASGYFTSQGDFYKIRDTNIFLEKSKESEENPWFLFTKDSKIKDKKNIRFEFKIIITIDDDKNYVLKLDDIKTLTTDLYLDTSLELNEVTFKIDKKDPYSKAEPLYNKQTIPKFLENQMMKLYERAEESLEYGIKKRKEGYVLPLADIKVENNLLKYTELWQRLSSDSPIKSFCVGRALQLLNVTGLNRVAPNSIKPLVFNTKFPLILNKSLPSPGGPLVTTPSIKSLQTLYQTPTNILKISNSDIQNKQITLDTLLRSFNSSGKSFEDIFELKGTLSQSEYTDPRIISGVRNAAIRLFQTQFSHSKKVENLLKKIFVIDNTITLNSDILDKGIRGIENIAKEARELLTEYYSNCQNNYMDGVRLLQPPSASIVKPSAPPFNNNNATNTNTNATNTKLNKNNNNNI